MGTPRTHRPVILIVGMISAERELFDPAEWALTERWGPIAMRTALFPFTHTSYYDEELGTPLWRRFLSFERLIEAEALVAIKRATNEMEMGWTHRRGDRVARRINLDPGYVTEAKLVLATTKDNAHRLYLGQGIFAEITLRYREGKFQPLEWTYSDYRTRAYLSFFEQVRAGYARPRD